MTRLLTLLLALCIIGTAEVNANDSKGSTLEDIVVHAPEGWRLNQDALSDGTIVLGFVKESAYVNFYVKADTVEVKSLLGSDVKIVAETKESHGPLDWRMKALSRAANAADGKTAVELTSFETLFGGHTYYGYGVAKTAEAARANVTAFLDGIVIRPIDGRSRSLTGADYTGKKYYFGWGAAGGGDPSMMHNEVKYDVLHTHDIFTKEIGGHYLGTKQIGSGTVNSTSINNEWKRIKGLMTANDMYVQYSSGHGSQSGLGVGVSYAQIRDNALSYPGKEIIIFIMACHSGGLVEAFDAKKSEWESWQSQGRTLMVMSSSTKSQTSSTGPGTDPDEANGPNGSAGSAFGHALWKALIGYADGYSDGVKDGFLSLGEIRDFSVWKTKKVGGHTPVHTGAYAPSLIMNKVPSKTFLESIEGSTEGLSDEEIELRIRDLDRAWRL